jgi:hypothetical protein
VVVLFRRLPFDHVTTCYLLVGGERVLQQQRKIEKLRLRTAESWCFSIGKESEDAEGGCFSIMDE